MMKQAEDMARAGDRQGAEAMLRQLQSVLESLRMGGGTGGMGMAQHALDSMGAIARQQQSLIDRSQRLDGRGDQADGQLGQQNNGSGGNGAGNDSANAAGQAQQALRQQLNALRHSMGPQGGGESDQALDEAGKAMDRAARALKHGQPGQALGDQADALSAMRQAGPGVAGNRCSRMAAPASGQTDPFGRGPPGQSITDQGRYDLTAPTQMQESRRNPGRATPPRRRSRPAAGRA